MVKKAVSFLLMIFLLASVLSMQASGGSSDDPEVTDDTSDVQEDFRNIVKAWIDQESNRSIVFNLQLNGEAPAWSPGSLISSGPIYEYGIYFSCKDKNYVAIRQVQFAFSSPVEVIIGDSYLRGVVYDNETHEVAMETNGTTVAGDFDGDNNTFTFEVDKSGINGPVIGDKITNIWAAVWDTSDTPSEGPRPYASAVDVAGSYDLPGKDYYFTGGFMYIYKLQMSLDRNNHTIEVGSSATYTLTINASSTNPNGSMVEVVYYTSANWTVTLEGGSRTVHGDEAFEVLLKVSAPEDAPNGTKCSVTVSAKLYVEEGTKNATLNSENYYITTTAIVPPATEGGGSAMDKLMDWITGNILIVGGLIGVIVVGIIVVAVKKKK